MQASWNAKKINLKRKFKAFISYKNQNGYFKNKIIQKYFYELPEADLLIKVEYSSLNYKDALSASGAKGVTKNYPHTPGIDAAGIIVKSNNSKFKADDKVIVTGFDLGMNTSGGFAEYIQVPSSWAIKCPDSFSLKEAMMLGTAGLTAGLCVQEIENHTKIKNLKVVVSGATGGVGSIAVMLLSNLGAKVTSITGKKNMDSYLYDLGSASIMHRDQFVKSTRLPLNKGSYDAAVDVVGGNILSSIIASMRYNGIITVCGNVADPNFSTTVFPFILRKNRLVGIDSASHPINDREEIWNQFASSWKIDKINYLTKVIKLESLDYEIKKILSGEQVGRVIIQL